MQESGQANVTVRRGTQASASTVQAANHDVTKTLKDAMAVQFKALGERLTGLETTMKYLSGQYDDMFKFYSETKASIAFLCEENKQLRAELNTQRARTKAIEDSQARQEQWSRAQNVEVVGVPETKDESTIDIVVKIAAEAGVNVQNGDIEFAHRVQPRRTSSAAVAGRAIVARFKQRALKDAVVAAARKNRNITTKALGLGGEVRRVFVNEHLTKENKQLLRSCKTRAAEHNYKHVWTKNCRIYVRKTDTSSPIPILCKADLDKI